jgi:glycosyltransferase involved in cell wall biosynthesis
MKIGYLMQAGVPDIRQRPLSGPANHVWHVYKQLEAAGHQMKLLAVLDGQIWSSTDLETFTPVTTVWLDRGPLRLLERAIRRLQSTLQLPYAAAFESLRFALACRRELADCDLWYERMGWFGYGGAISARWSGIPLVWEVNGDHLDEFASLGIAPRGGQRLLSVWLVQQTVGQTAHVIAAGAGWRDKFIRRWQIAPDKITTVENGTQIVDLLSRGDLRSFQPSATDKRPLTVVYVGGFYPWQGVKLLVEAVAQVRQAGIETRLLLIGSGPQEAELQADTARLGISGSVTFTGQLTLEQMAHHLAQADIGVSAYCGRDEFSGLKLLDYKAAGLAIIASGRAGQPAILEHGRTAHIVPPCDVAALSQAIQRLHSDANYRCCLGQNARIEAETQHSWRQTAVHIENILQQVIEKAPT